jgi:hypothetical protein
MGKTHKPKQYELKRRNKDKGRIASKKDGYFDEDQFINWSSRDARKSKGWSISPAEFVGKS